MAVWRSNNDGRRTPPGGVPTEMPIPESVGHAGPTKRCDACTSMGHPNAGAARRLDPTVLVELETIDGIELWLCVMPALCIKRAHNLGVWKLS